MKYATEVWYITFHGWRVKQVHLHVDVAFGVVLPVPIEPAKTTFRITLAAA
jgi:hypothetical protein